MKSQDAAKIFDELDMPILLEIIRNMKEPKVGPIIAQMNPVKAKEVSLEFAKISDGIESIKR
jgi:flagellar motility protein MotE (MotC chaperone)